MGAQGTATIDFGSWPGSNETSVAVTGQTAILSTSAAEAFLMAEASGAHTISDASYVGLWLTLSCATPSNGVGFTINARSEYSFTGTFAVRWVWSD